MSGYSEPKRKMAPDKDDDPVRERPQIYTELEKLSNALEILNRHLGMLEEKLAPVLDPRYNSGAEGAIPSDRQALAPLANDLQELTIRADGMVNHIGRLAAALEI